MNYTVFLLDIVLPVVVGIIGFTAYKRGKGRERCARCFGKRSDHHHYNACKRFVEDGQHGE